MCDPVQEVKNAAKTVTDTVDTTVSDISRAATNLLQPVEKGINQLGVEIDKGVNSAIPGGWATVAAAAAIYATGGFSAFGSSGAAAAGGAEAAGYTAAELAAAEGAAGATAAEYTALTQAGAAQAAGATTASELASAAVAPAGTGMTVTPAATSAATDWCLRCWTSWSA